jgi:hypothetical protein
MADHIRYSVSMDVVDEYTTTNSAVSDITGDIANVSVSYSRIHPSINKTLGGSGSINASIGVGVGGWVAGDPAHAIINSSNAVLGTFSGVKGVFIKHSGFTDDAKTTTTSSTLTIIMGAVTIAILGKGGAIVLPFETATTPAITATSSSGDIAVEVMGTN